MQVLSESVAHALESEGHFETAKFVEMFDKFFDCLNVSSLSRGHLKQKKYCYPYKSENDERLSVGSIAY